MTETHAHTDGQMEKGERTAGHRGLYRSKAIWRLNDLR